MFQHNKKTILVIESDIAYSYPVSSLNCLCIVMNNGKKYNATNVISVSLENMNGEFLLTGQCHEPGQTII
ncbi:hypothetical protein Phpb_02681 [Photorhabdus namnaonensis]|uniref:Uncharacterized protein n=1 Tax=Photorhabdus namnaonensis TaxID=1851568 RepID=A0A1B8YGR9_9GAMM|nr:hypothetical protein Phpb_02681 [Photorhabdus namnaonensis]